MEKRCWRALARGTWLLLGSGLLLGCGSESAAPSRECDATCRDEVAVRALRETLKLVYNLTLQGKPVGAQDETTACPLGGSAHVLGRASSLAEQGATELELGYELSDCAYFQRDDDPEKSYDTVINGRIAARGIMAVQPTATTALIFEAEQVAVEGSVFDPALDYAEASCDLRLAQNGNRLSGEFCGRDVSLDL